MNTYKIVSKSVGITHTIANKHTERKDLLYYNKDEKTGEETSRALRYATNVSSIFEDEQGDGIIKTAEIMFEEGVLRVPKRNPTLIKFLSYHPDNVKNGGSIFELVDHAAENKRKEAAEEIQFNAMALARELGDEEITAITRQILPSRVDKMTPEEKKSWVRGYAKGNPIRFTELASSSEVERENIIKSALAREIIQFRRGKSEVFWKHGTRNTLICRIPEGENPDEALERFLMSNDGKDTFEDIERALED